MLATRLTVGPQRFSLKANAPSAYTMPGGVMLNPPPRRQGTALKLCKCLEMEAVGFSNPQRFA